MEYRRLGHLGLRVGALSFGAWVTFAQQITRETAADLMTTAFDADTSFFDKAEACADGQGEVIMGSSRVEQLQDNLHALELLPELTSGVMAWIDGILDNKS